MTNTQADARDTIAQIVARAYGGSLYPGLGTPGDYPTDDVDYRAADAILASIGVSEPSSGEGDVRGAFYAESIAAVELQPGTQVVAIDSFLRAASEKARSGEGDDFSLVQAFARHRLSSDGEREALIEALERLERANDVVAARTSPQRYLTDLEKVQDALVELDAARSLARSTLLTALSRNSGNG
jgi:hypothetical protein